MIEKIEDFILEHYDSIMKYLVYTLTAITAAIFIFLLILIGYAVGALAFHVKIPPFLVQFYNVRAETKFYLILGFIGSFLLTISLMLARYYGLRQ